MPYKLPTCAPSPRRPPSTNRLTATRPHCQIHLASLASPWYGHGPTARVDIRDAQTWLQPSCKPERRLHTRRELGHCHSGSELGAETDFHLHGTSAGRDVVGASLFCGRIVPRDGTFISGAYGVIASCRAHGVVFKKSSDGMLFVRVIERRMASSLVSGRLRRDIMSDIVVGGMGMATW